MRAHVPPSGRAAIGFGAGRGYEFDDFLADAAPPAGRRTCCCPPGTCARSPRTPTSWSRSCARPDAARPAGFRGGPRDPCGCVPLSGVVLWVPVRCSCPALGTAALRAVLGRRRSPSVVVPSSWVTDGVSVVVVESSAALAVSVPARMPPATSPPPTRATDRTHARRPTSVPARVAAGRAAVFRRVVHPKSCLPSGAPGTGPLDDQIRHRTCDEPCAEMPIGDERRQTTPFARSSDEGVDGAVPTPFERGRGGVAVEVHAPAAVGLLRGGEALELGLDHGRGEQRPCRAAGEGREVQWAHELVVGAPGHVQQPVGRHVRSQRVHGARPRRASSAPRRPGAARRTRAPWRAAPGPGPARPPGSSRSPASATGGRRPPRRRRRPGARRPRPRR